MYAFLFDKKSLVMLAAAAIVLSGLLFGGGFLLGVQWGLPTAADEMAARQISAAAPPIAPLAPPPAATEPAATEPLPTEPITIEPASPSPAPAAPAPASAPATSGALEPPAVTEPAAAPAAEAPAAALPAAPIAAAPEPAAAEAPAAPRPAAAGEPAFSLQVGAFAQQENCDAVVHELASRGYQPYVVDLAARRSRVLHAVRIGRYEDLAAASQAAAEFRQRERQPAVVQPPGS
jgi:cell division septation protein DedD